MHKVILKSIIFFIKKNKHSYIVGEVEVHPMCVIICQYFIVYPLMLRSFRCLSNSSLKLLMPPAETTTCGREFHILADLTVKNPLCSLRLNRFSSNFSEWLSVLFNSLSLNSRVASMVFVHYHIPSQASPLQRE